MSRLKELKKGEYFTIKFIDEPTEEQVYVRGDYNRADKDYTCYKFSDTNTFRFFKGDKVVYTGFTF